jgi:hypothetical protein
VDDTYLLGVISQANFAGVRQSRVRWVMMATDLTVPWILIDTYTLAEEAQDAVIRHALNPTPRIQVALPRATSPFLELRRIKKTYSQDE